MKRTHNNGQLRLSNLGEEVTLKGWVAKKRDLGGLIFIDLRDKEGITQLLIRPTNKYYNLALEIKNEYVIEAMGLVLKRESINSLIPTGDIEIDVTYLNIINKALLPPLIIADKTDALEEVRLKYRYLDLRRPKQYEYIAKKALITQTIREYLSQNGFLELETPILAKSTPEGARDYLVPSRLYNGEFYALPQSPQIFKQLYMIAGFEKYFQIARCFRDEDLRADRQPEFNQIDLEMSFIEQEDIWNMLEGLFKYLFKKVLNVDLNTPFPRYKYRDVMDMFGSDKPDIRFEMHLEDITSFVSHIPFCNKYPKTKAIVVKDGAYTRKEIDEFSRIMRDYKINALATLKYENGSFSGSLAKFFSPEETALLVNRLNLLGQEQIFIISEEQIIVNRALGALRNIIGKNLGLAKDEFAFLWVTDWPVFEYDFDTQKYIVSTHPFTSPKKEDIQFLKTNPEKVEAYAYDLVLNGYELGSGSIRIYDEELQKLMFDVIGLEEDEIRARFGFFIDALKYGTPPHGGMGLGLERIVMLMLKTDNIRDVIAFPKTSQARDLMLESPSSVSDVQLKELHLKIKNE